MTNTQWEAVGGGGRRWEVVGDGGRQWAVVPCNTQFLATAGKDQRDYVLKDQIGETVVAWEWYLAASTFI